MTGKPDGNKAKQPTISQQAVDLVLLGFRRSDTARALGVRPQLVTQACQRAGIPNERTMVRGDVAKAKAAARAAATYRKYHGLPDPSVIAEERRSGLKFREIAVRYGITIAQASGAYYRFMRGGYRHA